MPSGHAEVNQLSLLTIEFDEVEGHEGWLLDYWFVITEVWDLVPFLFYFSRFTLGFVFDPGIPWDRTLHLKEDHKEVE